VVTLGELLRSVSTGYSASVGGPGQAALDGAKVELSPTLIPAGWKVGTSRRHGHYTTTPWLGFFDPDETTRPTVGLYVCWIFEPGLGHVVLTVQQGTDSLESRPDMSVPAQLRANAAAFRKALPASRVTGLDGPIDFGSGPRQRNYAAGSVIHRRFSIAELPTEEELTAHHREFCELLALVIAARGTLLHHSPGSTTQAVPGTPTSGPGSLEHFKPKSSEDYFVWLKEAAKAPRSRRHEKIVNDYQCWAESRLGWIATSPHPVDLRLRRGEKKIEGEAAWRDAIMVEVKVVYSGNATSAVREVIGQLNTYPHVVVPADARATLRYAGVFSESIGDLWVSVLEEQLGIATVWWDDGAWRGGRMARELGLVERSSAIGQ
jgi:hypothetical protein